MSAPDPSPAALVQELVEVSVVRELCNRRMAEIHRAPGFRPEYERLFHEMIRLRERADDIVRALVNRCG